VEQEEEGRPQPLALRPDAGANPAGAEPVREERPIKEDNGRALVSQILRQRPASLGLSAITFAS
jgi:hypothetical protein